MCTVLGACSREPASKPDTQGAAGSNAKPADNTAAPRTLTLYTSCDAFLARPIIKTFEDATRIRVTLVTDTEATKTMGLLQRLLSERDKPVADVWWSNEAYATASLAHEGLLAPSTPMEEWQALAFAASVPEAKSTETSAAAPAAPAPWNDPVNAPLVGDGRLWWGFALRERVIIASTPRVPPERARTLTTLASLADPALRGRIGMARPQFGTTRSHVAASVAALGFEPALAQWRALKDQGVRLYAGNSAVVQGVALAEVDVGLTDSDDVRAGKANAWPVEALTITPSIDIPNTVAIIKKDSISPGALALLSYLCSEECERALAASESGNRPVRFGLAQELGFPPRTSPATNWNSVWLANQDATHSADAIIKEVFPIE